MEYKQEQLETLLELFLENKNKKIKENSPVKKASGLILTIINLIIFIIGIAIAIGYGISSYNETVKAVNEFKTKAEINERKMTKIDSTITSVAAEVKIIHEIVINSPQREKK